MFFGDFICGLDLPAFFDFFVELRVVIRIRNAKVMRAGKTVFFREHDILLCRVYKAGKIFMPDRAKPADISFASGSLR